MNNQNIENMKQIVNSYFIVIKALRKPRLSSGVMNYSNPFYKYYRDVELAFSLLNKEEQLVINNDFFFNDYFGWWHRLYKEREYQRLKERAVRNFLRYFYEIH